MRIPLYLDIYKEDLSFEKKSIIIGFFDNMDEIINRSKVLKQNKSQKVISWEY